MTDFIDTTDELFAVPVGTVVLSKEGTIAARFDTTRGVVFGDDRTIAWRDVDLPAVVLWRPDNPVPQWHPVPPPEVEFFEQLLDLPAGSAIRTTVRHVDGHRVFEKFADGLWWPAGGARPTPIDRLEAMLPGRLIWHPEWT